MSIPGPYCTDLLLEFWPGKAPVSGWLKPASHFAPTGYRASKTALKMLVLAWHWMLRADGVKVLGGFAGTAGDEPRGGPGFVEEAGSEGSESWRAAC
ncbi:hypothetical protein CGLO_04061 [Colletotrichum gloeosporioides Cg-14]|uniref:Uncharacterized protein n=1 Tax=Colletotrichum gloeosporioides (strain Cg-14) TaxID=1237896 RepID=T0KK98_COLGC|nr:hypothetical protein CGLO_04061 [Colletotrichum gloeosporioides Cg-14]